MAKRDEMKKDATKNPSLWPAYKRLSNKCAYSMRKAISGLPPWAG